MRAKKKDKKEEKQTERYMSCGPHNILAVDYGGGSIDVNALSHESAARGTRNPIERKTYGATAEVSMQTGAAGPQTAPAAAVRMTL